MNATTTTSSTINSALPAKHLLKLPRPDSILGKVDGAVDTTTLAAHDFDIDNRTGFMPPKAPISRLPFFWSIWEDILEDAQKQGLKLGETPGLPEHERSKSEKWRDRVNNIPLLSTKELCQSELWLRRAHHVLAWTFHFYVHTHPPAQGNENSDITIPACLTLPLLRVSTQLDLPPVVSYADSVLYNWDFACPPSSPDEIPTTLNIRCQTLFTQTLTESEFFLVSARIELIGVRALDLMRATMDEMFVGDDIAARRITGFLWNLQEVVTKMKEQLLGLRETGCDPDTFYNEVRPWLAGCDSNKRKWVFEGLKEAIQKCERGEEEEVIREPQKLSGPSAGQSSLIHSLDIFLGVDKYSHSVVTIGGKNAPELSSDTVAQKSSFLARMQLYMPRHHRRFLHHLAANPRPLRDFVVARADSESAGKSDEDRELVDAYNAAVQALKEFRDAHMMTVTLYIISPAARARRAQAELVAKENDQQEKERKPLKGTGGTNLVQFLKGVRDQTKNAILPC